VRSCPLRREILCNICEVMCNSPEFCQTKPTHLTASLHCLYLLLPHSLLRADSILLLLPVEEPRPLTKIDSTLLGRAYPTRFSLFAVELIARVNGPAAGLSQQALTIYYPTEVRGRQWLRNSVLIQSVIRSSSFIGLTEDSSSWVMKGRRTTLNSKRS
jgi:hypothetical protein